MSDIELDPIPPKHTYYSDYRVNRRLLKPSMPPPLIQPKSLLSIFLDHFLHRISIGSHDTVFTSYYDERLRILGFCVLQEESLHWRESCVEG